MWNYSIMRRSLKKKASHVIFDLIKNNVKKLEFIEKICVYCDKGRTNQKNVIHKNFSPQNSEKIQRIQIEDQIFQNSDSQALE